MEGEIFLSKIMIEMVSTTQGEKRIVALLPMKAHSERVSGKNFRVFAGKPLFRWVLDTLLMVQCIDKIVINTDARSILVQNGLVETTRITVRDRKPELCGDFVSMNCILRDDVDNVPADIYLMTHVTNPLISAATIQAALQRFIVAEEKKQGDSLFSVNRFQARFYRKDGSAVNHDPQKLVRTQDLEPWFEENSNLYIFTKESFRTTGARIGKKPIMYETPRFESLDIDDQASWDLAELVKKGSGTLK
jgi:CMP-N-acetylneuraminic acid synthetase